MSLDLASVSSEAFLVLFTLHILNCWPTQPASGLENSKPVTSALVPFQVFLLLVFHHLSPFNPKLILWLLFFLLVKHYLVAQLVKNLPVMRETWVQSLGWEDTLERDMAIPSGVLAWRIP